MQQFRQVIHWVQKSVQITNYLHKLSAKARVSEESKAGIKGFWLENEKQKSADSQSKKLLSCMQNNTSLTVFH